MSRKATFALLVILGLSAGCRNGSAPEDGQNVEALPIIQPASGGEMVLLPAGSFMMGDKDGGPDQAPHSVSVNAFYIDKWPVTQEIYEKIMGVNPSKQRGSKNPVERMRWTEAAGFCNKCSEMEGLTPSYNPETWACNFAANGYRLPTEAEWEYACRAGGTGKFCCGDSEDELALYAWFKPQSQGVLHPVGQKRPNHWGLFDMHGNLWQWCNDWYSASYYGESPGEDPPGPAAGTMRVLRGGAWDCLPEKCGAAYRHKEFPAYSDACFGADSYGIRRVRRGEAGTIVVAATPPSRPAAEPPRKVENTKPVVVPAPATGKFDLTTLKGTIVFVSDRSGTLKIWSMHANGKETHQLTKGTDPDADPRFSPDGKQILYTTLRGGFPEVWLMNRDGSGPKTITKGSQGSWSPDGKSIVFIRDDETFVRELASGQEKRVTPKEWKRCGVPAFSPDGKHVAVASRHQEKIGIYILSLDGKENFQVKAEEGCCTPCWSHDGKKLLCQTDHGHIHQVGIDGKNWEQLTFGNDVQHDARFSPDEKLILFCRAPDPAGPWQICVKRADDDEDYVAITKEGSNLQPDWHVKE